MSTSYNPALALTRCPLAVAILLDSLQVAGAQEQVTALANSVAHARAYQDLTGSGRTEEVLGRHTSCRRSEDATGRDRKHRATV